MKGTSVFLAFMFLAGACGGSEKDSKTPSTTEAVAPDEKGEENIEMSPGAPAAGKPAGPAEPAKPAEPAAPAEPGKPATPPQ